VWCAPKYAFYIKDEAHNRAYKLDVAETNSRQMDTLIICIAKAACRCYGSFGLRLQAAAVFISPCRGRSRSPQANYTDRATAGCRRS
jgi:hypothetical protein